MFIILFWPKKDQGFNHALINPFFNTGLYSLIEKVKKRQGRGKGSLPDARGTSP